MSIGKAMNAGVSGLGASSEALGVVGDNIANANTVGFKRSRATFENVLGGAVGSNETGAGVRMTHAQQIFAQGTMTNTGQPTDLALSGDGFFVVNGSVDGNTGPFYTRAGQTSVDKSGFIVDPNGLQLQGYPANPDGTFGTALGPIQLQTSSIQPKQTGKVTMTANLDSSATTPTGAWDPTNPAATSNFSTSTKTFDSLGNPHSVDVYFRQNGAGSWDYHALVDGGQLAGGVAGTPTEIAGGNLQFTTSGALNTQTTTGGTVNFAGAAPGQAITFDFGKTIAAGGTGLGGTTQYGAPSNVTSQSQDGYASGDLTGVKVESDGTVRGVYTNGEQLAVGKLAVAKFRANEGLGNAGHNLWTATRESGEAAVGAAGAGGRASIVTGALEQSNVDIAAQFVDLIAYQRSFQANSKTITTADQMLQELMQIKQ